MCVDARNASIKVDLLDWLSFIALLINFIRGRGENVRTFGLYASVHLSLRYVLSV
jgi:hypothetical protein